MTRMKEMIQFFISLVKTTSVKGVFCVRDIYITSTSSSLFFLIMRTCKCPVSIHTYTGHYFVFVKSTLIIAEIAPTVILKKNTHFFVMYPTGFKD